MKIVRISAIWCPSCLIMRPRFEEIEKKYPNISSAVYDIDLDTEASIYNVGNILPVMILFDEKGQELERIIGEHKVDDIVKIIEKHVVEDLNHEII